MTSKPSSIMFGKSTIFVAFCMVIGSLAKPPPTFLEYKDSLGQYSFGYSAPGSARSEVRSIDGSTRGSYSYVDVFGNIQSAQYTADGQNGFQITATNLPQAPRQIEDTAEVAAAKIAHLKALEAASKLANENPQQNEQALAVEVARSADSIDKPQENAEQSEAQANSAEAIKRNSSDEPQGAESNSPKGDSTENSSAGNEAAKVKILDQPSQDGSSAAEAEQPQGKSAEVSSASDVPVVTTSFVIPGSLNLHTRIQLDQSSGAGSPNFGQTSSPNAGQQSSLQEVNPEPSISTPASTRTLSVANSGAAENSIGIRSQSPASTESLENINQPQEPSTAFVPAAIAPANAYGFVYGIGINPIYRHYSPYHYIPYTIL